MQADNRYYCILSEWWHKTRPDVGKLVDKDLHERARALLRNCETATEQEAIKLLREIKDQRRAPDAVWLRDMRVRVGDEVIVLEQQEACVLQALLELGAATGRQLRKRSGVLDAVKVFHKMRRKYPTLRNYLQPAGKRGQGGYRTTLGSAAD